METDELRRLIDTRRDLHRHPELAYQERRTAGIVAERLAAAGYAVETGIAETGVVGTLEGSGEMAPPCSSGRTWTRSPSTRTPPTSFPRRFPV